MKNKVFRTIDLEGFTIVATFFSLWLAVSFPNGAEDFLAFLFILTFGILHGSNDIKLIEKTNSSQKTKKATWKAALYYTLFIMGSGLLFFFLPSLALLLFILFSGYHFGEQHWVAKIVKRSIFNFLFFAIYGIFILFLIFSAHGLEVTKVIEQITGYALPISLYTYGALVLGILTCFLGAFGYLRKNIRFNIIKQVFFILVLYIVFNSASLLWAFAIYFIFWHSLPSMLDQIRYLYGGVSVGNIKKFAISSFPYWLVSVMGMGILLYLFKDSPEAALAFFFSFLAAITFPHVLVINQLFKS